MAFAITVPGELYSRQHVTPDGITIDYQVRAADKEDMLRALSAAGHTGRAIPAESALVAIELADRCVGEITSVTKDGAPVELRGARDLRLGDPRVKRALVVQFESFAAEAATEAQKLLEQVGDERGNLSAVQG